MTTHDDLDRRLSVWLAAAAPVHEPEGLSALVLATTARTRRRPAWRIPERWIPMATFTSRATSVAGPPWRAFALLAALLVAVIGGAILAAGTQRVALPPPFGLAANGVIAYSIDGSIVTAETPTSVPTPIIADGGGEDGYPWFSPDGSRFAFLRGGDPESPGVEVWIANADGGDARRLIDATVLNWVDWSPEGDNFMMVTEASPSTITMVRTDGSGSSVIETGLALVETPVFRPPDGATITFRGRDPDGEMGLYQVARDGSGLVRLELDAGFQTDELYGFNREYYFNAPTWDPTGSRLLYHTLEPAPESPAGPGFRIHVADVGPTGVVAAERLIEFDPAMDDEFAATFLPDAESIVYQTIEGTTLGLHVGTITPGAVATRDLGIAVDGELWYLVSPDGSQALVYRKPTDAVSATMDQVDLGTGRRTPLSIGEDPAWQRRAVSSP